MILYTTIITIIFVCALCAIFYYHKALNKARKKQSEIIEINQEHKRENQNIEISLQRNREQLLSIQQQIDQQNKLIDTLNQTANRLRQDAEQQANEKAEAAFSAKMQELNKNFQQEEQNLLDSLADISKQIEEESKTLKSLQDKQLTYILAQQRQKQIDEQQDYYRLVISDSDKDDINLLREIQKRLVKKDAIDKVIYETYYKPAYDTLMPRLSSAQGKICGIYKLTDLKTGQAYIGQSLDVKERLRQHIKKSLSCAPGTNKLYQAMQKSGQENFTFEILEEVTANKLNEREIYWINFYKTKDYGLNSKRGGS